MTIEELQNFNKLFEEYSTELLMALEMYDDENTPMDKKVKFKKDHPEIFDNFQFIYNLIYVFHENSGYPLKFLKE